ncbi:c-type cytochrome [Halomonas alkalisoli]|uniref:c-type cytochrome n=1 Tax=Halomonas alkalisoli TaxID=2907158 RepID=UPI00272E3036|nr:c-type cytochrome [Halomonas alkalisoli]
MTTPNRYHSATQVATQDPGRLLRFAIMLAGGLTLALALASPGHADESHGHSSAGSHAHAAHDDEKHTAHGDDGQTHGGDDHAAHGDDGHAHAGDDHAAHGDDGHAHGGDDHAAHGDDGHGADDHAHGDGGHGWKAPQEWAERESPLEPDAETLAQGMQVYQRYCSACHGPSGEGNGLAPAAAYYDPSPTNLALHGAAHAAGEYAWQIKEGNSNSAMPRFQGKLDEDAIWSVVLYIRHTLADEHVAEHKH